MQLTEEAFGGGGEYDKTFIIRYLGGGHFFLGGGQFMASYFYTIPVKLMLLQTPINTVLYLKSSSNTQS